MVRKCLIEKGILSKDPKEENRLLMWINGEMAFQIEGRASTKVLKWKHTDHI
jgi:hypothetical protein